MFHALYLSVIDTTRCPQSICYQLPALLAPQAVTLVISPLLSLIHDQVGALRDLGVCVEALTGVADKDEANRVLRALDDVDNPVNLLYGGSMAFALFLPWEGRKKSLRLVADDRGQVPGVCASGVDIRVHDIRVTRMYTSIPLCSHA